MAASKRMPGRHIPWEEVGKVFGHDLIKTTARMNGMVVLFVEKVERGLNVGGTFDEVLPLNQDSVIKCILFH